MLSSETSAILPAVSTRSMHRDRVRAFAARHRNVNVLGAGLTTTSLIGIWSAAVPSIAAIFSLTPLISRLPPDLAAAMVVDVERVNRGAGGIADKQHAVGPDSQGARRFQAGLAGLHGGGAEREHGRAAGTRGEPG